MVVALPVSRPLAQEPALDLERLAGETLVLLGRDESPGVRGSLAGATDLVHGDVQEVREMQTVIALVRAGVGISLVPESVRALVREGVVYRELPPGGPTVELAMAWRSEDRSPVLEAFKEVARERVAEAVAARRPPPGGERGRRPARQ